MEMPERDQEEYSLAAAILLLWNDIGARRLTGPTGRELYNKKFDQQVRPILAKLYGSARTNLGEQYGVQYAASETQGGGVITEVTGLDRRINEYRDRLWQMLKGKADEAVQAELEARNRRREKESQGDEKAQLKEMPEVTQADANRYAITELSKLQSEAELDAEREIQITGGPRLVAVWRTEPGACPICTPLDGTTNKWRSQFPEGPPAHPNCRCWLDWKEFLS